MTELIGQVVAWLTDASHWVGRDGIPARTVEHLWLALAPTSAAVVVAVPPAVWLAHRRRFPFLANAVVNVGRAVPSFGILAASFVFLVPLGFDFRFWPPAVALFALALPPVFTNTYAAIAGVPRHLVEAARGMGLTERQVITRIELPVGMPVILAGVEIALVQVVATVPLAAVIAGGGGFGQYIVRGFAQGVAGRVEAFAGAVLVAVLTLGVQGVFRSAERLVVPSGVRRMRRERPVGRAV